MNVSICMFVHGGEWTVLWEHEKMWFGGCRMQRWWLQTIKAAMGWLMWLQKAGCLCKMRYYDLLNVWSICMYLHFLSSDLKSSNISAALHPNGFWQSPDKFHYFLSAPFLQYIQSYSLYMSQELLKQFFEAIDLHSTNGCCNLMHIYLWVSSLNLSRVYF